MRAERKGRLGSLTFGILDVLGFIENDGVEHNEISSYGEGEEVFIAEGDLGFLGYFEEEFYYNTVM